jgi:alanyl-tRNA synthetase
VVTNSEWHTLQENASPRFVGYDQLQAITTIVQYRSMTRQGQHWYYVVLEETPFYPEGGGQVGDTGHLLIGNETIAVWDTKKEGDWIVHCIKELPSNLKEPVKAVVDEGRRDLIANNHTGTHLLQASLRAILGNQVEQKGSLVTPDFLRFDFTHYDKLIDSQCRAVEALVNQKIRENISLQEERAISLEKAKALGATALFGEKYSSNVRMITYDPTFSRELCGGTHAASTGKLGFFKIIAESSVAAATRRIEAVTGKKAEAYVATQLDMLHQLEEALHRPQDPVKALHHLLAQKTTLEKKLQHAQMEVIQALAAQLLASVKKIKGISTILAQIKVPDIDALKQLALSIRANKKPLLAILTALIEGNPCMVIAIADALVQTTSLNAHTMIQTLAGYIDGKGGGQPFLATAQGKDSQGLQRALHEAQQLIEATLQPTLAE